MKRIWSLFMLVLTLTVPLAACSPNVPEVVTPTPAVTSTPEGVLDDTGEAGKDIADDIGDAARNVTEDVKDGVKNAMR